MEDPVGGTGVIARALQAAGGSRGNSSLSARQRRNLQVGKARRLQQHP